MNSINSSLYSVSLEYFFLGAHHLMMVKTSSQKLSNISRTSLLFLFSPSFLLFSQKQFFYNFLPQSHTPYLRYGACNSKKFCIRRYASSFKSFFLFLIMTKVMPCYPILLRFRFAHVLSRYEQKWRNNIKAFRFFT